MTGNVKLDAFEFEAPGGCPVCTDAGYSIVLDRSPRGVPLRFVACAGCGLVYQNPRMTRASLQRYFSSSFFIRDAENEGASFDELLGYFDYSVWEESYRKT